VSGVPDTCCVMCSSSAPECSLSLVVLLRFMMETRRCVFLSGGRSWKRDSRDQASELRQAKSRGRGCLVDSNF
jgi:hypothetical protein